MKTLLLSTYELGHQPLGLAWPAAHLRAAGHQVSCQDLAVQHLDEEAVRSAEFVGISVPMHTATRLGVRLAERVRTLNPAAHVCFYGLYAPLTAPTLLGRYADSVLGGELEPSLVALVDQGSGTLPSSRAGAAAWRGEQVFLGRLQHLLPDRSLLPGLQRYSKLDDGTRRKLAGYVEASRGCAHRCLHCPIPPIYGGRLRIVPQDIVLEDIRQLVRLGAEHITFGDPDFFNGVRHSVRILEAMHAEYPELSFDATIKIEHLLEHRALLPALRDAGCAFVVSAVEAVDDVILGHLRKGHSAADVVAVLALAREAGLVIRPTFLPFTPWTSLEGFVELLEFVEREGLIRHVDPVQYSVRLLVPRGSSLLGTDALKPHLGAFDEHTLSFAWSHPDPRVDALQRDVAAVVEADTRSAAEPESTFARIKSLALSAVAGRPVRASVAAHASAAGPVPRLTEPWFC